ncbi:MAG: trigger factor [Planctomycetaceae bacterium]|nr:trigger factor [Planctomycetaceae bacterium]
MADTENRDDELTTTEAAVAEEEKPERMALEVKVDNRSTCERHVTVTVPHEDVTRYFDKEYTELMPNAQVPGFRPGHAPRKLVEARFRKDVAEKVKSELLMDCLSQVNEDEKLSAISEPDFDFAAVEIPEEGPLTFEFDIEVRPEFDLPQWKGLKIEKPVREFSDEDVTETIQGILARRGRLVPFDGAAESGDYITTNLTFKNGDEVLASADEEVIRLRPSLSFRDGNIEKFDKLMAGVRAGETREGQAQLTEDAPNVALRGQKVTAIFKVLEVKKLEVPELTPELLEELGNFHDEAELRDAVRDQLGRQLEYEQHQRARQQITAALTVAANWELPPGLLQRQSHRELQRAVLELQRSGFSDEEIQAHENALRQSSAVSTARALKEHFILERIAEEEEIDAVQDDYDEEIRLIAAQSNESPRRVRARLEKAGSMDVLRNQIIERKVIDLILEHAKFKETPYKLRRSDETAVDHAAGGGEQAEIPEAKYDEGQEVPEASKEEGAEHRPH